MHRHYKPSARPYAWLTVHNVLTQLLCFLRTFLEYSKDFYKRQEADQEELVRLREEVARLRKALESKPERESVTRPSEVISVTRSAEQGILYVMGSTGLARKWRIAERVQYLTETSPGTVRNAFTELKKRGLICSYTYQGKVTRYSYGSGRRDLLVLGDKGCLWYRQAYSDEPVLSELEGPVAQHKGVQHAVDILEVRDLLRARGLEVEEEPAPLLADEGERWGRRAEPDLELVLEGERWPVEVQREVSDRNNEKWEKALRLGSGRLIIIVETAESEAYQVSYLEGAWYYLAPGEVLVTSLERLRKLSSNESAKIPWKRVTLS